MRIIFAGTPEISASVLSALVTAKYNIIATLTQPDRPQGRGLKLSPSPVKTLSIQHSIPVLQPKSLKTTEIQQEIAALKPDLIIVLAYGLIVPQAILSIPKLGCVNIHASILPRWRGAAPIEHAILAGDTISGITIMQMDAGLDTGDMLATYPCNIDRDETTYTLYTKISELAVSSILDSLPKILNNELLPQKQNDDDATYAHKIVKESAHINWQDSAINIDRLIRAFNPRPVAFTILNETPIKIWQAHIVTNITPPEQIVGGTVINVDKDGVFVTTRDKIICITKLQLPGKKSVLIKDFWHSNNAIFNGDVFN